MNIPESAIKAGEKIFTADCGYTDTRHKVNLAPRTVPEAILREIEQGCTIETLERIASDFPICKYQTQITIHGKFPELETNRIGGYVNLVRNKNKSVGVRWSAIDNEKRRRLFKMARVCADWHIVENSTAFFIQRAHRIENDTDEQATLTAYQNEMNRINAASALFQGGCDIFKCSYWGMKFIILRVCVNSFYEHDFDALANTVCNMSTQDRNAVMDAYERKQREQDAQWERECEQRRADWERARQDESKRRAEFEANLKLPFAAEYGEHKARPGDIYAVVVHTERFNHASPFCVKYYTIKKTIGRLCAYECDEQGNITHNHGRGIVGNKYKGYRKTA